jgi:hypothetical protein
MTGRLIDLAGQKFGFWLVLALQPERKRYGKTKRSVLAFWLCRCCACGVVERLVLGANLRRGLSTSCGCLGREKTRKRSTKHNHSQRGKVTRAYWCWQHIKGRCTNPNNKDYGLYGGREPPEAPITVCEEWLHSFENFYADMGDPPPGMSLDRIDVNGPYASWNCRWADPVTQRRNQRPKRKRRSKFVEIARFADALARTASGSAESAP